MTTARQALTEYGYKPDHRQRHCRSCFHCRIVLGGGCYCQKALNDAHTSIWTKATVDRDGTCSQHRWKGDPDDRGHDTVPVNRDVLHRTVNAYILKANRCTDCPAMLGCPHCNDCTVPILNPRDCFDRFLAMLEADQ